MYNNTTNQFLSLDDLARLRTGSTVKRESKKPRCEVKMDFEDFAPTLEEKVTSSGELADLVVDKLAEIFGRDILGIAEEVLRIDNNEILCYKVVFEDVEKNTADYKKAVKNIASNNDGNVINQINKISSALRRGVIDTVNTVSLTDDCINLILEYLIQDNEAYNDRSNRKFESKYVTYDSMNNKQITVHGLSIEQCCKFIYGEAEYRVNIQQAVNDEFGRLLTITRLTHSKANETVRKYAGIRMNELRCPTAFR